MSRYYIGSDRESAHAEFLTGRTKEYPQGTSYRLYREENDTVVLEVLDVSTDKVVKSSWLKEDNPHFINRVLTAAKASIKPEPVNFLGWAQAKLGY